MRDCKELYSKEKYIINNVSDTNLNKYCVTCDLFRILMYYHIFYQEISNIRIFLQYVFIYSKNEKFAQIEAQRKL